MSLVERLRSYKHAPIEVIGDEAADRIEELERVATMALDALEVEEVAVIIERLVPKLHINKAITELRKVLGEKNNANRT